MDKEIEKLKAEMKKKKQRTSEVNMRAHKREDSTKSAILRYVTNYALKVLLTIAITLILFISLKKNRDFKTQFYHHVYDTNFDFATVNQLYKKYVGSELPFQELFIKKDKEVFNEKLTYEESHIYKDGVKLTVAPSYLVPVQQSGIVVFIGEKEGYGNTVIIQQVDGVDLWYGNVDHLNIKLYDYVEKGSLLGEAKDETLYLVYKKEGKVLDYKTYLS